MKSVRLNRTVLNVCKHTLWKKGNVCSANRLALVVQNVLKRISASDVFPMLFIFSKLHANIVTLLYRIVKPVLIKVFV